MKKYIKADITSINDEPIQVRMEAAQNSNTRPSTLSTLAKSTGAYALDIKRSVAENLNTPEDTLRELINDNVYIKQGLAANPNTPKDVLYTLFKYWQDRIKVVKPQDSEELDLHLLGEALKHNPNTPEDILQELNLAGNRLVRTTLYCSYSGNPEDDHDLAPYIAAIFDSFGYKYISGEYLDTEDPEDEIFVFWHEPVVSFYAWDRILDSIRRCLTKLGKTYLAYDHDYDVEFADDWED